MLALGILVLLVVTAACGSSAEPQAKGESAGPTGLITDIELSIDGEDRLYDEYVPATHWSAGMPSPIVVLLHGQRSSRADLEGTSRAVSPHSEWQRIAESNNLLLMVPQGSDGPTGHSGWNDCRTDAVGNPGSDDVAFITAALEQMSEKYEVDSDRTFAVGTSNGGHMAIRLAQEAPDVFTGIGVIAAGMPINSACPDADSPVSAVFMWGTDDPIAPFAGGAMEGNRGDIQSADASIQYWVDRNQASPAPALVAFPDIDSGDNSTVQRFLYEQGDAGARVALYQVVGGGHTEPSIVHQYRRLFQAVVGEQNHDIEMAAEVWDFFTLGP